VHIKNISKVTFQDLRSVCIKTKVSNWWHFIYSWRDLTPLLHVHLQITKKYLVTFDAIKASVPKFLNFLGAKLNNELNNLIRRENPSSGW